MNQKERRAKEIENTGRKMRKSRKGENCGRAKQLEENLSDKEGRAG